VYFDFDKKPITKTKQVKPKKSYNWLYLEWYYCNSINK
jgi:hypothetical protein